jgi:hypothetical protein
LFYKSKDYNYQKQGLESRRINCKNQESRMLKTPNIKDKAINDQKSRVLDLESDLRTKDRLVDTLQTTVAFLSVNDDLQIESIVNATDKTAEEKVIMAFKKGTSLTYKRLGPLAIARRYIRARKLEWQNDNKDKAVVELGNMASHYGMALADAVLFQDFYPSASTDLDIYMGQYVLHPDFVWKYQECTKLVQILDWYCAMKDLHAHSYAGVSFEKTRFYQLSKKPLSSIGAREYH